jgi:two-component system invasion response regulator UvrY
MIKIALVDDHVVLRKSLALLINMLGGFEVTIEAGNGTDFIGQMENNILPDIVLLDIAMPVTAALKQRHYCSANIPN